MNTFGYIFLCIYRHIHTHIYTYLHMNKNAFTQPRDMKKGQSLSGVKLV